MLARHWEGLSSSSFIAFIWITRFCEWAFGLLWNRFLWRVALNHGLVGGKQLVYFRFKSLYWLQRIHRYVSHRMARFRAIIVVNSNYWVTCLQDLTCQSLFAVIILILSTWNMLHVNKHNRHSCRCIYFFIQNTHHVSMKGKMNVWSTDNICCVDTNCNKIIRSIFCLCYKVSGAG